MIANDPIASVPFSVSSPLNDFQPYIDLIVVQHAWPRIPTTKKSVKLKLTHYMNAATPSTENAARMQNHPVAQKPPFSRSKWGKERNRAESEDHLIKI